MRKSTLCLAFIIAMVASFFSMQAQQTAPNRLIITDKQGNMTGGYAIDYIGDLRFVTVEGEVEAVVDIIKAEVNEVVLSITRTPACESFSLSCIPGATARLLDDSAAVAYVEENGSGPYFQDFESGSKLTNINLEYSTEYCIITVGYDNLGIAGGVSRAYFTTPDAEIIGEPYVKCTLIDATHTSYTIQFTPNEYVSEYYCCSFKGGTIQEQFNMFGASMGYANINEMIAGFCWNISKRGEQTETWDDEDPNTTYDIGIAIKDLNGNFVPYQVFTVSTLALGGEGMAYIDIQPEEYELQDWNGEMLPSQFFYFWMNENTWRYRFDVFLAEDAERVGVDKLIEQVCQESPSPFIYGWWMYEDIYTDFQIDPDTEVVVIAGAQNSKGEWGEPNVLYYTTPDYIEGLSELSSALRIASPSHDGKVASRIVKKKLNGLQEQGKSPRTVKSQKPQLKLK